MIIESTKNEIIKSARFLSERKGRLETGLHLVEGEKLVCEALKSGIKLETAFIEENHDELYNKLLAEGTKIFTVSHSVMKALSTTCEPQFVCATAKTPTVQVPDSYQSGLIVVLDEVQDPGNMGTIIRTADAFGADCIVLSNGCADAYSPKVVRSTMGSVYHLPIFKGDIKSELQKMQKSGFDLICGHLKGTETLPAVNKEKVAIIIGNEGHGVSDTVANMCKKYRLPMYGKAESLNASVAAGILIYEFAKLIKE